MSDFNEYTAYYKKAWEMALGERTMEYQTELEQLRELNEKYKKALSWYAEPSNWSFTERTDYDYYETAEADCSNFNGVCYAGARARKALGIK